MGRAKIVLDKEILQDLYIVRSLSTHKIGDLLNCSWATIANRIREYHIPLKTLSRARIKYPRVDFSGDLKLKAYMIGFRIGDLNVYKPKASSETVVVRCHTTQEEQVDVIKSIFNKFGHITVSDANGHMHVNCYLNQSFEFLLDKSEASWAWLSKNKNAFAPFVAGYTDAEGNFIINQGRARFKIDSYDFKVLKTITHWLLAQKINFKFRQIYKSGDVQYIRGVKSRYNGDLWRLNINEADSIKKFIILTKPYLRHPIRIKQTNTCLKNINKRKENGTI